MVQFTEKNIILSGTIFGSLYIFSNSLNSINNIVINRNEYNIHLIRDDNNNHKNNNKYDSNINKILLVNGITMLFSGAAFSYLTYFATK
jgi:hypothetical protein